MEVLYIFKRSKNEQISRMKMGAGLAAFVYIVTAILQLLGHNPVIVFIVLIILVGPIAIGLAVIVSFIGFMFVFGALSLIISSIISGYILSNPYSILAGSFFLLFIGAFFLFAEYMS